jgi:hypothetical protein
MNEQAALDAASGEPKVASVEDAENRPRAFALSPAIGPMPAIYVQPA